MIAFFNKRQRGRDEDNQNYIYSSFYFRSMTRERENFSGN